MQCLKSPISSPSYMTPSHIKSKAVPDFSDSSQTGSTLLLSPVASTHSHLLLEPLHLCILLRHCFSGSPTMLGDPSRQEQPSPPSLTCTMAQWATEIASGILLLVFKDGRDPQGHVPHTSLLQHRAFHSFTTRNLQVHRRY